MERSIGLIGGRLLIRAAPKIFGRRRCECVADMDNYPTLLPGEIHNS
jgi:hypothetical protein